MANLDAKLSSDILFTTVFKISLKVRGLVLIPLLTIGLSTSDYGAYMQLMAITTLIGTISLLGVDGGIVKHLRSSEYPNRLFTSLTLLTTAIGMSIAAVFAVTAEWLSILTLRSNAYGGLFAIGALYIPATVVYQLGRSRYRAQRRVKFYSVFEAIEVYLTIGGIAIAVLVFEASIVGAFAITIAARLVVAVLIHAHIIWDSGIGRPTKQGVHGCIRFSLGTMIQRLSQSIVNKADRILLGAFIGATAVGVYSVSYSISYIMLLYFRPLSISFFPEFSRLWEKDDYTTISRYTRSGLRYLIGLGLPSIAGFALIGPSLLDLLSTAEVARAGAIPLVILAGSMLCKGVQEIFTQLFYASGDSRTPSLVQSAGAIVNVLLNFALIPYYGVLGAAITSVLSFGLGMMMTYHLFQQRLQTETPWTHFIRFLTATGVMYILFTTINLYWILTLLAAPALYVITLVGIGEITRAELARARSILL